MNGKKARQLRRMTKHLTPSLEGRGVQYGYVEVDINVIKRMDREVKYEKRRVKQTGDEFNSKNIKTTYGTVGHMIKLSGGCRRHYYQELKSNYKEKMINGK